MVPTEVLANQHYKDLAPLLSQLGIKCSILLGSTSQKEKRSIYASLAGGEDKIDVIIGTHALLNDNIQFENLGLIITDEQHRFGANQRSLLKERNKNAHTLVMSATPIPRTLALTIYGDLSVSIIDEMPKGRSRVDTFAVDETYRPRLNTFISKLVSDGGQVYIVCPAIEDTEEDSPHEKTIEDIIRKHPAEPKSKLKNIIEYTESLKSQLPDLRIEFLHGKMKSTQKDEIMKSFSAGDIEVLVSTTVIEVGINVPNACLMIVENAERFGLSQLHQLRGRVGRGARKSYCVLVSDSKGANAKERLNIMKTSYDGYKIAECDLQMRGPGDFFASATNDSIRQSGGLSLRFSSLYSDTELLRIAFEDASQIISKDPYLSSDENSLLVEKITKMFTINENTLN
jgi:ATP-dependent DNA helicase RecG